MDFQQPKLISTNIATSISTNQGYKRSPAFYVAAVLSLVSMGSAIAEDSPAGWFVRPYVGVSQLSDMTTTASNVSSQSGPAEVTVDNGFTAGLGVGYRLSERWAAELAWEYRSNDSSVELPNNEVFPSGNYASNTFFVNAFYYFEQQGDWRPYVGGGLSWLQEIDIDLERDGVEQSYSGSGDTGWQLFAGFDYPIAEDLALNAEIRTGSISSISLSGEADTLGSFSGFDYQPVTLQIGLNYQF